MNNSTQSSNSSNGTSENSNNVPNGRYSFSSGHTLESEYEEPFSYSPAATGTPGSLAALRSAVDRSEAHMSDSGMFLRDVPMEGSRIIPNQNGEEETIIEFEDDHSYLRKTNQEYYDVLAMANQRLSTSNPTSDKGKKKKKKSKKKSKKKAQLEEAMKKFKKALKSDNNWEYSSNGIVSSPQISQGLTPEQMMDFSIDDENEVDPNDEVPRSSLWRPAALVTVAASKSGGKIDRDGYYKPLNGGASGTAGQTNATVRGTGLGMFYERLKLLFTPESSESAVQRNDFNLQTLTNRRGTDFSMGSNRLSSASNKTFESLERIDHSLKSTRSSAIKSSRRSSKRNKLKKTESIVWGDESIVGSAICLESRRENNNESSDESDNENDIEMHDYSYNTADRDYRAASERVVQKMVWRRERRILGCLLAAGILFLLVCVSLYASRRSNTQSSYSMPPPVLIPNNSSIVRDDPPPRPDPLPPRPVEGFYSDTSQHPITAEDLDFIIKRITIDHSALSDPNSPQGRAFVWCKTDLVNNPVDAAYRVSQRYSLAVLYYSTNGEKWKNSTDWLEGHECSWFGIRCELGDDTAMEVTYIDLSNNSLEGQIPLELGFIVTLRDLQLWGNALRGSIPQSFLQLVDLLTLYLDKNELTGEIYNTIESMRSLKHLDLSFNKLKGKIPHGLGSITSLIDLRLSNNHFSGGFPVSFEGLPNLQTLLLDNNAIGGTLPASIAKMPSLVTLRIHENDLMGNLPDFSDAVYLEEAHLDENDFSGTLPNFGSVRLRSLYLGRNAFTGPIPDSFGELSKLEDLYIQANHLTGPIPVSISKLTALQQLDLSFNRLTGPIPQSLAELMQLREFVINDNRLTGNLPDLGSMKRIEIARLNNNLLSGDLKFSLKVGDLNYLKELSFQNNELNGVVPEFICDLMLNVLTADCWGPSSPVDCPCCSACF